MPNLIGQSIGRYHILEQLGEGGMAIVYKAYDTRLERDVAVKVIRTERLTVETTPKALKRFEHEAKALGKLTHPNIIPVSDYGEYEGKPYLVMPYLPSGTLKEKMEKPIPWREAIQILLPIAEALDYAHSLNMIHRDVKPSNILLTERGKPMLTDFGIAKILDLEETQDLTGTNAAVGTPEYMAPEQAISKSVDHRADIYSLGVVLYEMVTGRKPYIADTPMAVLIKHSTEPLPRPKQFAPDLPDAVEKVLLKALAKKPEDRYQDMGEMVNAFEKLQGDGGRQSASESKLKIKPNILMIIFGLAVLVLLAVFGLPSLIGKPEPTPQASMTPPDTAMPASTSKAISTEKPNDTPTPTKSTTSPQAEQARAFAEPILTIIAQRKPDFEDDFSKVNPAWRFCTPSGTSAIEAGVARNQGDRGCMWNETALTGKDFVLQLDARLVSGDTTSQIIIRFHAVSVTHDFNLFLHPAIQAWDVSSKWGGNEFPNLTSGEDAVSPVGKFMQIMIVTRGSRFALYLNQTPVGFFDNSNLGNAGKTFFTCMSDSPAVCEYDNVKFWDLSKVTGLP